MSNYQPRIAVMPVDKVEPFAVIAREIVLLKGSVSAAAPALGVSRIVVRKLLDQAYLTDKQARLILASYRRIKSAGGAA